MLVSIVVATYNRADMLRRSIASLQQQTWSNIEVIIVDDGSTDNTSEVVALMIASDSRLRYVALEHNCGSTVARNRGIELALGDAIMVWDSDDVLYPQAIEEVCLVFSSYPNCFVVSAPCRQIKGQAVIDYTHRPSGFISTVQIVSKYLPNNEKVRVAKRKSFSYVRYQARNIDFMVNGYLSRHGDWYHINKELGDVYLESDRLSLTTSRKKFRPERSMERVDPLSDFLRNFKTEMMLGSPARYGALHYGLSVGQLLLGRSRESRQSAWLATCFNFSLQHLLWLLFTWLPFSTLLFNFYIKWLR